MRAEDRPYIYRQQSEVFVIFPSSKEHCYKSIWKWQHEKNRFTCTSQAINDTPEQASNFQENSKERASSFKYFDVLYGVLTIDKSVSFLLYVAESAKVATIDFSRDRCVNDTSTDCYTNLSEHTSNYSNKKIAQHEIYEVTKFEWMQLPTSKTKSTRDLDGTEEDTVKLDYTIEQGNNANSSRDNTSTSSSSFSFSSWHANINNFTKARKNEETTKGVWEDGHKNVDHENNDDKNINNDYSKDSLAYCHCLLEQFCQTFTFCNALSQRKEHTFLYYSPTCNIALSPHSLIKRFTNINTARANRESINKERDNEEEASTSTFQWNRTLLSAFPIYIDNDESNLCVRGNNEGKKENERADVNDNVYSYAENNSNNNNETCFRHSEKDERQTRECYYLPVFIRGYVEEVNVNSSEEQCKLLLITRLACRWCGTRYNRRGAEPNNSGVCANMAITSFWFFHNQRKAELSAKHSPRYKPTMVNSNNWRNDVNTYDQNSFDRLTVIDSIRGSVPLQWSQPSDLSFKPTITINEKINQMEVLERHFALLSGLLPCAESLLLIDTMSTSRFELPLSSVYAHNVHAYSDTLRKQENGNKILLEHGADKERSPYNSNTKMLSSDQSNVECKMKISDGHCVNIELSSSFLSVWRDIRYLKINLGTHIRKLNLFNVMEKLLREVQLQTSRNHRYHEEKQQKEEKESSASHTFTNNITLTELLELPWVDYSLYDIAETGKLDHKCSLEEVEVLRHQTHYIRINCLDCIDRTNIAQTLLLHAFLIKVWCTNTHVEDNMTQCTLSEMEYNYLQHESSFRSMQEHLQEMMTNHGIALSLLYAHTPTHFRSTLHAREKLFRRCYSGGKIAMQRWYQQNFADGIVQDALTLLTGQSKCNVKEQIANVAYKYTSQAENNATAYSVQSFVFSVFLELFIELLLTISVITLMINMAAKSKYGKCSKLIVAIAAVFIMVCALLYRVVVFFKRARSYLTNFINKTILAYDPSW